MGVTTGTAVGQGMVGDGVKVAIGDGVGVTAGTLLAVAVGVGVRLIIIGVSVEGAKVGV
jgi:hypothetical protein